MDKRTLRSKKGRPRNVRPYDHQNQSIFGKVYSTVKGLLNPTWLFNVPQWIGNSDQDQPEGSSDEVEEDVVRDDNDIVSQSVSHGNKRLRLRLEGGHVPPPSIQNSGTQTWHEQPTTQNLFQTISLAQPSETQTSLLDNKETIAVLNGDDHSENSEGSASTSGCSSLVSSHKESNRLPGSTFASLLETKNRKRKEPSSKCEFSDLNRSSSLWSTSLSPSSKFQRRLSHTNQPAFKLSSFVGPSKLNESVEKKTSSPFYEGRTTFGGASAFRRMPPSVTPYQVDKTLRNQIKTREQNLEDNLEGMSSAAKRILLTLEKMSTPVADAKKIPNSDKSPVDLSLYLTPPKSRRNSQYTPSVASKGPPIANINTIAKFATLKNFGASRLRNTLQSSPVASVAQKSPVKEYAQPNASETPPLKSGGGKMKVKLNQQHQPSRAANSENELAYDLPSLKSVPLPISTLPTINFGSKPEKTLAPPAGGFTFSNPIQHELSINSAVPASSVPLSSPFDSFKFSNPIEHPIELPSSNNTKPKEKSLRTWECRECWVRNPEDESSCAACETPRISKETKTTTAIATSTPIAEKVSLNNKDTWECSSCWVRNPMKDSKCMACETPKTTDDKKSEIKTSSKSSAFSTTWECTSCWVRNSMSEKKCMACETLHPSADEKSGCTFKSFNKSGTASVISPAASQSTTSTTRTSGAASFGNFVFSAPKTDTQNTPVSLAIGSGSGFTFGISKPETTSVTTTPSTSTTFGANVSTSAAAFTGGFVFGAPKSDTQTTTSASFAFGSGSATATSTPIAEKVSLNNKDTWECSSCWVRNPMKNSKCMACETPKTTDDKKSGSTFKGLSKSETSVAVSSTPSQSSTSETNTSSITLAPSGGFMFSTPQSEAKTTTTASAALASSGFTFGLKKPETSSVSTAEASPSATSGPNLSTTTVAPSSGFAFAATSKTETQTTTPATFSFGSGPVKTTASSTTEKVSSNKDIWECSSCWVKNSARDSKCIACEAPKPTAELQKKSDFSFKGFSKPETTAAVSSAASQLTPSGPSLSSSTTVSSSGFVFATPKTESQNTTPASLALGAGSGFTFKSLSKPETTSVSSAAASQSTTTGPNVSTSAVAPSSGFAFAATTKSEEQTTASTPFTHLFNSGGSGFTFKGLNKTETTSAMSSAASQSTMSGPNISSSAPKSAGGFVFATPKIEAQNATPASFGIGSNAGFSFKGFSKPETTSVSSSATAQSTTSGPNISTSTAAPSGGFAFSATPKTESQTTAPAPFAFGSGSGFTFKTENPQTTPAVSSAPQAATSSAGLGTSGPGGFVFSTPKTEAPTAAPFSFSAVPMSSSTSAFSGNNPVVSSFQGADKPATGGFNFGAASSGVFQFGASNNISVSSAQSSAATTIQSTGGFVFRTPKTEPSAALPASFSFGGIVTPSSSSAFSGTNPVAPSFESGMDKPATGGFNFGVTSNAVFQFGSSNNSNADKKRPAGFSFGTTAAPETNNTFANITPNFNMSTPPSFNFAASSTPAGPFQFAASTAAKPAPAQSAPRKYRKAVRRGVRKD